MDPERSDLRNTAHEMGIYTLDNMAVHHSTPYPYLLTHKNRLGISLSGLSGNVRKQENLEEPYIETNLIDCNLLLCDLLHYGAINIYKQLGYLLVVCPEAWK